MLIAFFLCISSLTVNSQMLRDTSSLNLVRKEIDNIYNLKFAEADAECNRLSEIYPEHPVTYLIKGLILYWERYPILPDSHIRASFEIDMRKCIELSGKKHNPADEAEFLLANLSARSMLLLFYTDNDLNKEAFPLVVSTYKYIRRSFDYTSVYNDFLFFTGLYNYYREAYPKAYPLYKSIAILFPKGDKDKGIKDLHTAATNSILFKAESSLFLSEICLSFENNYEQAYEHSKYLHELYPSNILYLSLYIKNLLLMKHYDEAEEHLILLGTINTNSYYEAQLSIYNGILQEKKYHNNIKAEQLYLNGISEMSAFGYFGNDFAAYGYFGLSRINKLNENNNSSNTYLKKALELADFGKIDFN
jgi:hypothetical protein